MDGDWRVARQIIPGGQIWFIEQPPGADLSAAVRRALGAADAVIYDPALATRIKSVLPLGCYSEPWAAATAAPEPRLAPRALKLAAEGWRVAQLVTPNPARPTPLHQLVTIDGCELQIEVSASPEDIGLATVLAPLSVRHPGEGRAFTANGLAG